MFELGFVMRTSMKIAVGCGLGMLVASAGVLAQVDVPQLASLDAYETPFRWENVEGAPVWLDGQEPRRLWRRGLHVIDLEPGEFSTVRVPAGGVLRANKLDDVWRPDALQFYRSDGDGLWVEGDPQLSKDGRSLADVDDRGRRQAQLVRVERSPEQPDSVRIALFVGRYHTLGEIVPARERFEGPEEGIAIRRPRRTDEGRFWPLAAHQVWTVELEGPTLLEVQSRFRYPSAEASTRQSYFIRATLDDAHERWIEHDTGAENTRMLVGEKEVPVGRLRFGYLDVPEGRHVLRIESSAPLYLQLLARRDSDFLLPGLNQPERDWTSGEDDEATVEEQFRSARRVARNNHHREGGLLGWRLAARGAAGRPDVPRLASYAQELRAFHTFYRPLLPETRTQGGAQHYARFLSRSLAGLNESKREIFIAEQHLPDSTRNLGSGYFHAVPGAPGDANLYYLPRQSAASVLRVTVDLDSGDDESELWVQIGHLQPRHLRLTASSALRRDELRVPQPLGGLALLDRREPYFPEVTLAGPMSRWSTPAPLLRVASAEITLPADVEEIRLWSNRSSVVSVALDYRTARRYALSETAYLSMMGRAGGQERVAALFHELVAKRNDERRNTTYEEVELASILEPAARLLRSRIRGFEAPVGSHHQPDPATAIDPARRASLATKATRHEDEAQPLLAFEAWSQATRAGAPDLQLAAFRGQVRTLRSLGESFLRDRFLRAAYLSAPSQVVRDAAFDHLVDSAEGAEELLTLRAMAWRRVPDTENLRALVFALLPIGEYETALVLGLMLDPDERPVRELLRAAYQLDWWTVYQDLTSRLEEVEREFWSGHRALKFGRVDDALQQFQQAGRSGEVIATAVRRGEEIARRLQDGDRTAVFQWERWQAGHPGPRRWSEAADLISGFAGSSTVYSIERDLYSRFYRATPGRPLSLRVSGPVRLRLEARPLLPIDSEDPIDDWLFIRKPGRLQVEPINSNRPAAGLRLVGPDPDRRPGMSVVTELNVEPGVHEIEVYGGNLDLLVRVFAERPEMPLGILPALTPETFKASLTRDRGSLQPAPIRPVDPRGLSDSVDQVCALFVGAATSDCFTYRPIPRPGLEPRLTDGESGAAIKEPLTAIRVALRTGELLRVEDVDYRRLSRPLPGMPASERILAVTQLGRQDRDFDPGPLDLGDGSDTDRRQAHLARGNLEEAVRLTESETDEALLQRLNLLLYWAETVPDRRADVVMRGQILVEGSDRSFLLQSSYARLVRGMRWQRITSFDRSAGLVRRQAEGWAPESPALRVRRALLRDVHAGQRAVVGVDPLHFYFSNLEPVDLELELSVNELDFLPGNRLRVFYQLDDEPPVGWVHDQQEPRRTLPFTIEAGRHSLRVWNSDPLANQYLLVAARVSRGAFQPRGDRGDVIGTNRIERAYHVATAHEPIAARVLGPAVLRIHELDGQQTRISYRHVEEGWQTVELHPRAGRSEGLFRIFESVADPERRAAKSPHIAAEPVPVRPALAELPDDPAVGPFDFVDRFPLGGQEDGTWSTTTRVTQPADVDDIAAGGNENDQYLEVRATHRHFDETERAHTSWSGLVRFRERGGQTIGLQGLYRREPERWPFSFTIEGGTYAQRLESLLSLEERSQDDMAWSAFGRASLSDYRSLGLRSAHLPRASLFVRHLSVDTGRFADFRGIDQDVFTTYKDRHRAGLQFADTLFFFPWLDTEWWARGALVTNERLNPLDFDHVELRGGWRQLLGDLRLSADYRHRLYSSDGDRPRSLTRRAITLSGAWEPRLTMRHGIELGLWLRRDFDTRDTRASFYLTWHRSNGRGYRDFRPRETEFQRRRHLRLYRRTPR